MSKKLKVQKKKVAKDNAINLKQNKIKNSFLQRVFGFIELARPMEWSKSLLNMLLATLIAYYVYTAGVNLEIFVIGFVSVAFLWSALYTLNDYTDWKIDLIHDVKKNRPIPSGKVSPAQAFIFSMLLIVASYGLAFYLNNFLLVVCLTAMVVNQFLYTMEPFRLKSRKGLDLVSGSMINPIFRYLSGLVLFVPPAALFSQITPLLPFIFVVGIQFSGYSLYRLFSKGHDKKVKMKSTVALMDEEKVKMVSYTVIGLAVLAYVGLFLNGFTIKNETLGFIPLQYLIAPAVCVVFLPFMKEGILNPSKADMKKNYSILYLATLLFIFITFLVFLFLR
jgi:4-hydroxybenzoate polyprenyltransferase